MEIEDNEHQIGSLFKIRLVRWKQFTLTILIVVFCTAILSLVVSFRTVILTILHTVWLDWFCFVFVSICDCLILHSMSCNDTLECFWNGKPVIQCLWLLHLRVELPLISVISSHILASNKYNIYEFYCFVSITIML